MLSTVAFVPAAPGAAVQHQTSAALRPVRLEETSCEACTGLVESAEDFLTDPKTEKHLSSLIVDALCTELPQQLQDTCVQVCARLRPPAAAAGRHLHLPSGPAPSADRHQLARCRRSRNSWPQRSAASSRR